MKQFGILFDLDGTLVNSLPDICGVVNAVRVAFHLPPLEQKVMATFIGRGVESLIQDCFPELSSEQRNGLKAEYAKHYAASPTHGGALYPGVRKTLEKLRSYPNVRLGICTNKPTPIAIQTVEHYLPGFKFDYIAGPEAVSKRKPAPEHLTEVMTKLEVDPENTWFVGDDMVDFHSAQSAKVTFLAAGYGFGSVKGEPEWTLTQFYDLLLHVIPVVEPKTAGAK